jgi:hypothetical protein
MKKDPYEIAIDQILAGPMAISGLPCEQCLFRIVNLKQDCNCLLQGWATIL